MSLSEFIELDDYLIEAAYQEVEEYIHREKEAQHRSLQDMTKQIESMRETGPSIRPIQFPNNSYY